jgi:uncharacterized protein (TIGR02452 family)
VREHLRAVAAETVEIASRGWYLTGEGHRVDLGDPIAAAVAGTRLYLPGDPVPAAVPAGNGLVVTVENQTTLAAASALGGDVACLVFASARHPGGGFLNGARAQEESLARASALHACQNAAPGFYAFHRQHPDPRYSDQVIYAPAVPVFRDDDGTLLARPFLVSFLTAAAPNLGAILASQPGAAASVPGVLRGRALRVLEIAAAHRHRRLILGAWGCGVFRNDPALVAATFAGLLRDRPGWFDQVVFAVHDNQPATPTYAAFASALAPAATTRDQDSGQ